MYPKKIFLLLIYIRLALIQLQPPIICFQQQSNDKFEGEFKIISLHDGDIVFKIRTTNPQQFQVKPSQGILESHQSLSIFVKCAEIIDDVFKFNQLNHSSIQQPKKAQNQQAKDKFQVLVAATKGAKVQDYSQFWKTIHISETQAYYMKSQYGFPYIVENLSLIEKNKEHEDLTAYRSSSFRSSRSSSFITNDAIDLERALENSDKKQKQLVIKCRYIFLNFKKISQLNQLRQNYNKIEAEVKDFNEQQKQKSLKKYNLWQVLIISILSLLIEVIKLLTIFLSYSYMEMFLNESLLHFN